MISGELNDHLAEINTQAENIFQQLIKQMAEREGITEKLKAENQMKWVGAMNSIQNCAKEIVMHEIILN